MKRRDFLKYAGAAGSSLFLPSSLDLMSMYKRADASVDYVGANVVAPAMMPQVISIYLYGGPSELAGNLTNMPDSSSSTADGIESNSQNSYQDAFSKLLGSSSITELDTTGDGTVGQITQHGFWHGAGGVDMEFLLGTPIPALTTPYSTPPTKYMSVYRTLHRVKEQERSHRTSILMNLHGSLDVDSSPGVGTRVAALLYENRAAYEAGGTVLADNTVVTNVTQLTFPFVSFEGVTPAFALDPNLPLPKTMQNLSLSTNFDNPYSRQLPSSYTTGTDAALNALVAQTEAATGYTARYQGVVDAFSERAKMDTEMSILTPSTKATSTTDTSGDTLPTLTDQADIDANARTNPTNPAQLAYPDNRNNEFTDRIRAAVTLALKNPSSLYITVGGGIGGWDDHNDAVDNYPQRMADLMAVLRAAMLHIKYFNSTTLTGAKRKTNDNIIINVFGDFGRQVNLNGSSGWDHGNNQNLYTFGGSAVRAAGANALGKVVGQTQRVGKTGTNNQVTQPIPGSYQFEPMSVASTIYSYFGATNSAVLTADPTLNPSGDVPIDETQPAESPLF